MLGQPRLVVQTVKNVTIVTINEPHIRDTTQVQQIATDLYDLVDNKACKNLILDFRKVVLFSSSALGMLITLNKRTQALGGKLVLVGVAADIYHLFKLAKMQKLFIFRDSEDQALEEFGMTSAG